jgi:hypothetical protein
MNDNVKPNGPDFPEAHAKTPEQWRSCCLEWLAGIERLREDIVKLNANFTYSTDPRPPIFFVSEAIAKTPERWRSLCLELVAEFERLRAHIMSLKERTIGLGLISKADLVKKLDGKSYEEIVAMYGSPCSLEDVLREFEQKHGS